MNNYQQLVRSAKQTVAALNLDIETANLIFEDAGCL